MKSSGLRAGNVLMFSAPICAVAPEGSSRRTPKPSTLPFFSDVRSGAYGDPAPLDSRAITGIVSPCRCSAVVSSAAAGVATKCPRNPRPRACARRKPGT